MPDYVYTALDKAGKKASGGVHAKHEGAALKELELMGLIPLTLTLGQIKLPWWAREFRLSTQAKSFSDKDLFNFFSTLSRLLNANLKLSKALSFCERHSTKPTLKIAISKILSAVENGETVAHSLEAQQPLFPSDIVTLVRIGEETNTLSEVSKRIAKQLKNQVALKSEIQSALLYPCILIFMSLLVLAMVIFFLVPTLLPVFASSGEEPPAFLKFMDSLGKRLINDWLFILIALTLTTFLIKKTLGRFQTQFFNIATKLPLIGKFLIQKGTRDICATLSMLLSSGTPITKALQSLNESTNSAAYKHLISKSYADVSAGLKLSSTLSASPLIDDMAKSFIEAGEESNNLPDALDSVANLLETSLQETLNRTVKLLTPILTLIVGLLIGFIVYSTISTILDINNVAF